jgi:hypothetical protein
VASDLVDCAAKGQLEGAQPVVERLETMTRELMQLVDGLPLDALSEQVGGTTEPGRAADL